MKKIFLIAALFIFIQNISNAQFIPKRWALVLSNEAKNVYVDTTSIRDREKQYIFWTLEVYRNPINVKEIPEPIFRAKTQYIINDIKKKYSVIGILYYDKIGRLIGENYNRSIAGPGEVFSSDLESNQELKTIADQVELFLEKKLELGGTDTLATGRDETKSFFDRIKKRLEEKKDTVNKDTSHVRSFITSVKDTLKDIKEDSSKVTGEKEKTTGTNISGKVDNEIKQKEKIKIVPLPQKDDSPPVNIFPKSKKYKSIIKFKKPKKDSVKTAQKNVSSPKYEYNSKKERPATKTIFTDGTKFVVQVSSWKNKSIAEKQVSKLKQLGYNAFIMQVYIKKKRGTWNRVRVGYFDSLREAKSVERAIRKVIK